MIGTDILFGIEAGANDIAALIRIGLYVLAAMVIAAGLFAYFAWRNWFKKPKPNTSPRVRTIITFDAMQEAHGDVVEIRKAAA